jgi:uncharacterized protein YkwD
MADCERCGATDDLIHTCNHCKGKFCPEHTLPENHHCPALRTDEVSIGNSDFENDGPADEAKPGPKQSRNIVDDSPDFKSSPDVAVDGAIAYNEDDSEHSENNNTLDEAKQGLIGLKGAVVGGFVSPQYRGRCPNCDQYVSESIKTDSTGIVCCKNCGWKPGYPLLRLMTHRFNWYDWKRRANKLVKLTLVLIAVVSFAAIFGTGITPIDNTADDLAESAGLDDDVDRVSTVAADVANSSSESSEVTDNSNDGSIDERRVEGLVHQYVNKEREQQGLPTISHDEELRYIARNHSEDMAARSYFQHEDLSGDDFNDRYDEAGYNCRVRTSGDRYTIGGENIAQTWFQERIEVEGGERYYDSEDDLARGIVNQWMNSPEHRQNILREYWESEGVGIEITDSGKVYATQNFC